MKAKITEHDDRLELVIDTEGYDEHIMLKAFLRENATVKFIPISDHRAGSLTLGSCKCEERYRADEATSEPTASEPK